MSSNYFSLWYRYACYLLLHETSVKALGSFRLDFEEFDYSSLFSISVRLCCVHEEQRLVHLLFC